MALYPDYPIRTERLTLRPFTRGDVDAVYAYRRREDVARYLFDVALSREECALAVQQRIGQVALEGDGDKIILAVELDRNGSVIGEVSLILRSTDARQGEVGWIFDPEYQGQGFGSQVIRLLEKSVSQYSQSLYLEVAASNLDALRLYHRLGYDCLNTLTIRKDFHRENLRTIALETVAGLQLDIREKKP